MLRHLHRHETLWAGRMNMTPMIDVTFLLLTFFMLASHFASAEKLDVDLPRPDHNQAVDRRFADKVIINMVYHGEDRPPAWTIGAMPVATLADLAEGLGRVARVNPDAQVILRADRRLGYGQVRQVMELIAGCGLSHLQVVTELD